MADDKLPRKDLEVRYAQEMAERLDVERFAAWSRISMPHRVSVHSGCILVLWQMGADLQPKILDRFTVVYVDLSWQRGMELKLMQERTKIYVGVDHRPQQLATGRIEDYYDIFVWSPFFPDTRFVPHPGGTGFVLKTSMCIRMARHPDYAKAGDMFLMPVGEFRGRFPQFADTRF